MAAPSAATRASLLLLSLLPCSLAMRTDISRHSGEEHDHMDVLMRGEMRSAARTYARFAAAFPEMHSADSSCPYGDVAESTRGGTSSYSCNWKSAGAGKTCPALQQARLKPGRNFIASNYKAFVDAAASNFPLRPLFDKTESVRGDETYEHLVELHIKCLLHPDVKLLEDKLLLKDMARKLNVPATTSYFGAHLKDWKPENFKKTLESFCEPSAGVDEFMIKATHLSWSAGMEIVRGWQEVCKGGSLQTRIKELTAAVETNILGQLAKETDAHLREMEPGVSVEELFRTGGESMIPLEAKVQVVWGKAYLVWLVGQDTRGCQSQSGAWHVYPDKTGWDLKGMISSGGGNDEVSDRIMSSSAWDTLLTKAEDFAKGVGADFMRVDFFLGIPEDPAEEIVVKLNECESVSGHPYWHERDGMADVWRDGYVLSDRMSMTEEKWAGTVNNTQRLRDEVSLDS